MTHKPRTIGILGGSFNPAHAGHRHISLEAMKRLGLDEVWWLVSPQNPLKSAKGMASFEERFASAAHAARHPRIKVSDFEQQNKTRYTAETLKQLTSLHPEFRFIWLMGADNLAQIHKWKNWRRIFERVPVAVYDRAGWSMRALHSKAAKQLWNHRQPAEKLKDSSAPAWAFLHGRRHPLSASFIRNLLGEKAFFWHNESAVNARQGAFAINARRR